MSYSQTSNEICLEAMRRANSSTTSSIDIWEGFYIHAKRRVTNPRRAARYIGRYIRHPTMAESRIINVDEKTKTVTFWYQRNVVKDALIIPTLQFIDKLVRLIPDKNLKLVRYYDLYARRIRSTLRKILTPLSRETPKSQLRKTPIKCPRCMSPMELQKYNFTSE